MEEMRPDTQLETWVRALADDLTTPRPRECLLCFVRRMLAEFGCDTTLRFARHFRDLSAPRAVGLERRLAARGGFCDCEIFLNGWEPDRSLWTPEREVEQDGYVEVWDAEPPASMPACVGVRLGSTQPCASWQPLRRRW